VYVLLLSWSLIPFVKERKEGDVTIIEKGDFYFPNASEQMLNFWASRYVRFFKNIHSKHHFDLVHCHDHYGAFVGDKIKNEISLPYLCTIHNSNIMNDRLVGWKKAYLPRILSNADRVISVGKKLADTIRSKYKIDDVKVIPNYIDTDKFCIKEEPVSDDFRFLFVGGLEAHKGVLELVKAFHKSNFDDAMLHIVGSGILENDIKTYIEKKDLNKAVKMYGDVPNHELPDIYNDANVYVSVSEYETFGVTVLEAMSCGLPILYTPSGGPDDLVEDFAGLMIRERTIEAISNGLIAIKRDYNSFDRNRIRRHVVDNYGAEKVIGSLIDEYKNVLNAKA